MEPTNQKMDEQPGMERTILCIFTLYIIAFTIGAISKDWPVWVTIVMWFCVFTGWHLHITKFKSFAGRSLLISLLIQFCILLYGLNSTEFERILPTLFVMVVVVGLYGVVDYVYIAMAVIFAISIKFFFMEAGAGDVNNRVLILRQLLSIVVFEILIVIWIKKRNEAKESTGRVIVALSRAEQSKNDFLANISHEIRTPLNTVLGMSDIALRDNDVNSVREKIYHIQNAGRNLMSAVNDILDFTELQSGDIVIDEETYNICSIVNDIVNMSVALKDDKKIEIIVNMDDKIPQALVGDEKKIRRVAMNLVSNAIKFTENGYVEIRVGARREIYGVNLFISVKDTGIGISEENVEKLFSSFNQVDSRRNRQEGGMGLGLAISKEIVEKMGGVITVNSKLGEGTKMTVVVPQKVADYSPAVYFNSEYKLNCICYIDMERFVMKETRDAYQNNIFTIIKQTGANCLYCRNLEELKRRIKTDIYNYAFITVVEYLEDISYFDALAQKMRLFVILDRENDYLIRNKNVYKIYKPCYILTVASMLNQLSENMVRRSIREFIAPEAHLLVVDDNYMNLKVIEGLLDKYQIRITKALSGSEALEKIEEKNYDFVFMDHMMPEMDGVETFQRIREKSGSYYKTVPIIALTANAVAGSKEMFLKEGFTDFVEKPVEISSLEKILKTYLPEEKIIYKETDLVNAGDILIDETLGKEADNDISKGIDGIDIEKGMMYCGGEEGFFMILSDCCEEYIQKRDELNALFAQQDWKNYCIKMHALKGIMRSIGADFCSECALKLEMACKEENYYLVLNEHANVMRVYEETMMKIASHPKVNGDISLIVGEESDKKDDTLCDGLMEIEVSKLEELCTGFEAAMYSLDEAVMKNIINELNQYSYNGKPLKDELKSVEKKVNQSDYFSAGELLNSIKAKL